MSRPPVYNVPPPQIPPPPRSGNGLLIGLIVGAVLLVAAAAFGLWFLAGAVGSGGSDAAIESSSATSKSEPTHDGAPATEVRIESITMSTPASSDKGTAKCEYHPIPDEQRGPEQVDVGSPGNGEQPDTGTQDMTIATNHGDLEVKVDNAKAPCTAASFDFLTGKEFFDHTKCHRLTTQDLFVLQCGDPSGTGRGGPAYQYDNEYEPEDTAGELSEEELAAGKKPSANYTAGTVAMANAGEDTNGSQFFIVYKHTYLPPSYTIFGELTTGLGIVKDIAEDGAVTRTS